MYSFVGFRVMLDARFARILDSILVIDINKIDDGKENHRNY